MTLPVSAKSILSAAIPIFGLEWTGWLLLYKRLSESQFQWPRNAEEVQALTQQQFRWLMEGLTVTPKKAVKPVKPPEYTG